MHRTVARLTLLLALAAASGCTLLDLRRDLQTIHAHAMVQGTVAAPPSVQAPIVVVLVGGEPERALDTFVLPRPGPYWFTAAPGTYRVGAYVARDGALAYDPARDVAYLVPAAVTVRAGEQRHGVDLDLGALPAVPLGVAVQVDDTGLREIGNLGNFDVGTVVRPDDPRFSDANGKIGLWQPVEFVRQVGAGIYFYEPYDPAKIPVLFVHGAGGHPGNFRYLATRLDRTRFQPWLVYYPSALRPETAAEMIMRWIMLLGVQYRPTRFAIVAHSMGGLVSRSALQQWMEVGRARHATVDRFVTISTPWNGHPGAKYGADAPVVMPAWPDLVPDSAFLQGLFTVPLPPECRHTLLFSYGGGSRMYGTQANDGTVLLSSELLPAAQAEAVRILGFDASHGGILERADVSDAVNATLAEIAP